MKTHTKVEETSLSEFDPEKKMTDAEQTDRSLYCWCFDRETRLIQNILTAVLLLGCLVSGTYSASEPPGKVQVRTTQIEMEPPPPPPDIIINPPDPYDFGHRRLLTTQILLNSQSASYAFSSDTATVNIPFDPPKNPSIQPHHVHYSIESFQQKIFYFTPYILKYEVEIESLTETLLQFKFFIDSNNKIRRLDFRYFVIDPLYQDAHCFQFKEYTFTPFNSHLQEAFSLQSNTNGDNLVAEFLTAIKLEPNQLYTQSYSLATIYDTNITKSSNETHYSVKVDYTSGLGLKELNPNSCSWKVRIMIVYQGLLQNRSNYEFFYSYFSNSVIVDSAFPSGYNESHTLVLVGLNSFERTPNTSIFKFTFSDSSHRIDMSPIAMSQSQFLLLAFNAYQLEDACINPLFPIKKYITGANSGEFDCHDSCMDGEYLIYSQTSKQYQCNDCAIDNCTKCQGATECTECQAKYDLTAINSSGVMEYVCILQKQYFFDLTTWQVKECHEELRGCIQCYGAPLQCSLCEDGYFLNTPSNQCSGCTIHSDGCIKCNQTHCLECDAEYAATGSTICTHKDDLDLDPPLGPQQEQIICQDSTNCEKCDSSDPSRCLKCFNENMTLIDGRCQMVCGDGIIGKGYEECDDGNTDTFDGCSSQCQLQTQNLIFECINQTIPNDGRLKTHCTLNKQIALQFQSLQKVTTDNKLLVYLSLNEPLIKEWADICSEERLNDMFSASLKDGGQSQTQKLVWTPSLRFTSQQSVDTEKVDSSSSRKRLLQQQSYEEETHHMKDSYGTLVLEVAYEIGSATDSTHYESLNHQTMHLTFDPRSSQYSVFANTVATNLSFALVADNNQILQYYDSEYYGFYSFVKYAAYLVTALTYAMLIASIVFGAVEKGNGASLMVLEFCGVPQLLFAYLAVAGEFNPLMAALAEGLQFINGVPTDFLVFDSETETLSRQLAAVGYSSPHVADNSAAVVCVLSLILVVGLALKVVVWRMTVSQQQLSANKSQKYAQNEQNIEQVANDGQRDNEWTAVESLDSKANFLLINVGFVLLMFFSYGLMINLCVQIVYAESFHLLDFVVLGMTVSIYLTYTFLIVLKTQNFSAFLNKIQTSESQNTSIDQTGLSKGQNQIFVCKNYKNMYLLFLFVERFLNGTFVTTLDFFIYQNAIPIIFYVTTAFLHYNRQFYALAQNIRISIVLVIGCTVQSVLLYRKIATSDQLQINSVGQTEDVLNQYIGLTMIIAVVIALLCTFLYVLYSFKRVRCFDLQIQKPKIVSKSYQLLKQKKAQLIKIDEVISEPQQNQESLTPNPLNRKINKQINNATNDFSSNVQNDSANDIFNLMSQAASKGNVPSLETQRRIKNQINENKFKKSDNGKVSRKNDSSFLKRDFSKQQTVPASSKSHDNNTKGGIYLLEEQFDKI